MMGDLHRNIFCTSLLALALAGCGDGFQDPFDSASGSGTATAGTVSGTASGTASASSGTASGSGGSSTTSPIFDVGGSVDIGGPGATCKVVDDMNAVGDCGKEAPADSFSPDVQWTWGANTAVGPTALVANLTDDNDDGAIDLCDVPEIIVITEGLVGEIVVLSGDDGSEQFKISGQAINPAVTPAVGDIDGDGFPEIVAVTGAAFPPGAPQKLVAFAHDGSKQWTSAGSWTTDQGGAVAIADIDNDDSPEIVVDGLVVDSTGATLWQAPEQTGWFLSQKNTAVALADIDGDMALELILGQSAYDTDGTELWNKPEITPGYPQVANLDDDPEPEIIVNNSGGITILENDGTVKFKDLRPTGDPTGVAAWFRPSTVHDFDGDQEAEFAVSSAANYSVFEPLPAPNVKWSAPVQDGSGWAAGTAFDFLGDGGAEAMYADEVTLFIFDDTGTPVLSVPRSSKTLIEYPIVADVDNDGSSEIVVTSSQGWDDVQTSPGVQVIRDAEDRWIQARRIWNQHTYHVTNVREDGTIPQFEPPSWQLLNTYRTNAQIEDGSVCKPDPAG